VDAIVVEGDIWFLLYRFGMCAALQNEKERECLARPLATSAVCNAAAEYGGRAFATLALLLLAKGRAQKMHFHDAPSRRRCRGSRSAADKFHSGLPLGQARVVNIREVFHPVQKDRRGRHPPAIVHY
jgi:hypothetical protein